MLLVLLVAIAVAEAAPSALLQNRTILGGKRTPSTELPCPRPSDIHPCSCLHTGADFARIWCNDIRPTTDFKGIFNRVSKFQITALWISDSSLDHLPAHLLLPLYVNQLQLSQVNSSRFSFFKDISRTTPAPRLLESLYSIAIDQATGIDKWDWSSFQTFKILDQVIIRHSSFPRLTKSFGSLPNTVKTIEFDYIYDMESIAHGALARLHNLERLKISNTRLQTFERNALPRPASNLAVLDLSNNELNSLSPDLFSEMPTLTVLSLNGNRLTSLAQPTFAPINFSPQFQLYVMGNPFNCDCNLRWLNTMYRENPEIFGNDLEMICSEPEYLRGEFLHALEPGDFECGKNYDLLLGMNDPDSNPLKSAAHASPEV